MRQKVSDEICNCGHRKSQHEYVVCGWWNCNCKQFEPLRAEEPKREPKPFEEFPHAGDIISADTAGQEVDERKPLEEFPHAGDIISADTAGQEVDERKPLEEFPHAGDIISAVVAGQEVDERKSLEEFPHAGDIISADVAAREVEELRSKLRATQEENERLKQLQDGNYMLATRLAAENDLLRKALAEIKRLVEATLPRP